MNVNMKQLRNMTGLSQSQFAKKFHLKLRTLQSWEQNTRPTPEFAIYLIGQILEYEGVLKKECIENESKEE